MRSGTHLDLLDGLGQCVVLQLHRQRLSHQAQSSLALCHLGL
jgi:hypothetical protein